MFPDVSYPDPSSLLNIPRPRTSLALPSSLHPLQFPYLILPLIALLPLLIHSPILPTLYYHYLPVFPFPWFTLTESFLPHASPSIHISSPRERTY